MITLNDALIDLVKRKVVAPKDALAKSVARAEMKAALDRLAGGAPLEVVQAEGQS
jgi:hypothetical protein